MTESAQWADSVKTSMYQAMINDFLLSPAISAVFSDFSAVRTYLLTLARGQTQADRPHYRYIHWPDLGYTWGRKTASQL